MYGQTDKWKLIAAGMHGLGYKHIFPSSVCWMGLWAVEFQKLFISKYYSKAKGTMPPCGNYSWPLNNKDFKLRGSIYRWIFFNKYMGKIFWDLWPFEKKHGLNA